MSALRGMVALMAGAGRGLVSNREDAEKKARQDKEDAWRDEQRDNQRAEIAQVKADRQGMRDAGAERTTMTGTVTEAGGNKYLSADPAQAASMQAMLAAEAEMTGAPAPTQQAGTGITGAMARGHQITTEPVDLKAINGAEAKAGRFQSALEAQGKPLEAMQMSNAVMENKAKALGLESAQLKAADDKFNRDILSRLDSNPDWTQGAADFLTETQLGGLAGVKVAPVVSADGKTVSFVGTAADGTSKPLAPPMPNTPEGRLAFTQRMMKVSPEVKISWLSEQAKAKLEAEKTAKEDSRWQQTFDFNKKKDENDQQHRNRVFGLAQAQEGRAQAVHKTTMEDAKIPPGVKLQAASLAKQIENIDTALNKSMAEGQFDPNNAGTTRLLEQQVALNLKYSQLVKPYIPGAVGAAGADPLGLNSPPATGAPAAPAPAPAVPPGRPPAAPAAAPAPAPVAPPPTAPAQPPRQVMSLADAIAGPGTDKTLRGFAQQKAGEVQALADGVRAAQGAVVQAAQSGDQATVQAAMQRVAAERARLNQSLANMNPQQAQQVLQAAGIQ